MWRFYKMLEILEEQGVIPGRETYLRWRTGIENQKNNTYRESVRAIYRGYFCPRIPRTKEEIRRQKEWM